MFLPHCAIYSKKLLGVFVKYFAKFFCAVEICVAKRNLSNFLQCNTPFGFDTLWVLLYSCVMARWLITVHASNKVSSNRNKFTVNWIRGEFLGAGFTVTDYAGLYYTPLNRQRFYVQSAKESAITAFLLRFNSNSDLSVERVD
jgi:hypothetical protein